MSWSRLSDRFHKSWPTGLGTLSTAMKVGCPVFKIMKLAYPEPGIGDRQETLHC